MNLSSCGINCDTCEIGIEKGCSGCHVHKGNPFWGQCDLYACAAKKSLSHCGKCGELPCAMLKEWASSENDGRIEYLKALENALT